MLLKVLSRLLHREPRVFVFHVKKLKEEIIAYLLLIVVNRSASGHTESIVVIALLPLYTGVCIPGPQCVAVQQPSHHLDLFLHSWNGYRCPKRFDWNPSQTYVHSTPIFCFKFLLQQASRRSYPPWSYWCFLLIESSYCCHCYWHEDPFVWFEECLQMIAVLLMRFLIKVSFMELLLRSAHFLLCRRFRHRCSCEQTLVQHVHALCLLKKHV